ncbi:MAG TPA: saccharopine dehydrogenase NADP-binding domain-containing protein [Jatrophihabitans sp.]|nr:saccharopine dehydrogenase NADP-binding domain-containing protein [Jatrophihabitans sp.]
MADPDREHDIVVFGATGFVGRLVADYLATCAPDGVRIALAGRSLGKLERVRAELADAADWPLLVADSQDDDALAGLARSTRVVATTVGPYLRHGLPLVQACAAAGTHYADLTGEPLFMRRSIDAAHEVARNSGARIVHSCGFDSIPSDLGVYLLHRHAVENGAGTLQDTALVVRGARGGVSGGTVDSLRAQIEEAQASRDAARLLRDPYSLSPDRSAEPDLGDERDSLHVVHDPQLGGWLAPFVMGSVNTRVVRRSNALLDYAYGRQLRYREYVRGGPAPLGPAKAAAIATGTGALVAGLSYPLTRRLLDRVLPAPGEGPSEHKRRAGFFRIDTHTRTSGGAHLVCRISAPGDPGYEATAVMLGESALALAGDVDELPAAAGVLTPATALGSVLAGRLRAAGQRYDVATAS